MKKKKIALIVAVTVAGNYFLPISGALTAHADVITANKKVELNLKNDKEKALESVDKSKLEEIKEAEIANSKIEIINAWGSNAGEISFNPINKTLKVSGYNLFLGANGNNFLNISIYNVKNETTVYKGIFKGNDNTSVLSKALNNVKFNYGDVIKLSYNQNQGNIEVSNNGNVAIVNSPGNSYYKITKDGLVSIKENMRVNPLEVLNGSLVKKGTITGTTNANSTVNIKVNGEIFKGISNSKGNFSINIVDSNGFTPNTNIRVFLDGQAPVIINPTAPKNLGIGKDNINLPNNCLGTAENISFNPSTMKLESYGNAFLAQLINPKNGQVEASVGNNNFNVYDSKNNLNGASFNYGDIITIYEPEENYLSDGNVRLINGKTTTSIDVNGVFKSYRIEPTGLVQVQNESLNNIKAEYIGDSNINIVGKTKPNKEVTVFYGSSLNKQEVVKSNEQGTFKLQLPISDAQIGTQIEVYLNDKNIASTLVKYDSEKFNTSNEIQIVNNADFPVIGMTFDLVNNKINANVNQYYKTYAGVFYGNKIEISILSKDGKLIKSVTSKSPAQIEEFANSLNGLKFTKGDILKVQYNNKFVSANVLKDKKEIGNSTGNPEYFEITNQGLVNLTEKFIEVNPLNIINGSKVVKTTLSGKVGSNQVVTVTVNGQAFTGKSNDDGYYSIPIKDSEGFDLDTNINVVANGYLEATINPTYAKNIELQNSSINLYTNGYTIELSNIGSKIGFNLENKTFNVVNYKESLGNGQASLFNFGLYNSKGQKIFEKDFNNGSTKDISQAINGKSFNYGDIIEISFNPMVNKPVILNGNNVIGDINGEKESFKITPEGLVRINIEKQIASGNIKESYVKITNKNELASYVESINKQVQKIDVKNVNLNKDAKAENSIIESKFVDTIGEKNLEAFYGASAKNANFLNWVLNNNVAMEEFLGGPNPDGKYIPEGQTPATYIDCLNVWSNIWNTYTNSHEGFNLRLAIAVALTNGQQILSFPAGEPVGSPVQRYNIFETLNAEGGMLPVFKTLGVNQLCFITNTDIKNNQIMDIRNIMLQNHNGLILENGMLHNGAFTINYNTRNPHTGASVFGDNFYGKNPNIYSVWYDGGVCGATGRLGADVEKVFGIPATQTPQPGHNAFIYYNPANKTWQIGNAVDGWASTYYADMSSWSNAIAPNSQVASYNVLYQKADNGSLEQSNNYKYLAAIQTAYSSKLQALEKAIQIDNLNLGAWIDLVNLEKNNKSMTIEQYNELANKIISTFGNYPMPMYDLLLQLKDTYMEKGTQEQFNNYVKLINNELKDEMNKNLPEYQSSVAKNLLTQMKGNGLFKGNTLLGGSSIQIINGWGTPAGKILFNSNNMEINISQYNAYLGSYTNKEFLNIKIYNQNKNKVIYEGSFKGDNNTLALSKLLNGKSFGYGDIIAISHDTNQGKVIVENNGHVISNDNNGTAYFEITNDGLVLTNLKTDKLNKEGLSQDIINAQMMINKGIYTQSSINALNKAILNGQEVMKNNSVTENDVEAAISNINNAIQDLVKKPSNIEVARENLVKIISIYKAKLSSKEYTNQSNEKLQSMMNIAENILQNKNSTTSQYKEITELLNNNLKYLIKKTVVKTNNKEYITNFTNELNKIVSILENPNSEKIYTKDSIKSLQERLVLGAYVKNNKYPKAITIEATNLMKYTLANIQKIKTVSNTQKSKSVSKIQESKTASKTKTVWNDIVQWVDSIF